MIEEVTYNNISNNNQTSRKRGITIIDDSTKGIKTYKRATSSLKDEYDGKLEDITVFRMQLINRCKKEGWSNGSTGDIINIPKDGNGPANGTVNIIKEHSQISKTMVEVWASNTILSGTTDRRAQNNENINICISNTLTKKFLAAIYLKELAYTINGTIIAPLRIKMITQNAEMDTRVTSVMIRINLQHLDTKIIELNSNVHEFVEFVEGCIQKLKSRGDVDNKQYLTINITKGLKVVKDKAFREQFQQIDFEWLSGKSKLNSEDLLHKADTYYKVSKQNNLWGELSKEEQELIVMQAKFKDMILCLEEDKQSRKKKRKRERSNTSNNKDGQSSNAAIRKVPRWKLENKRNDKTQNKSGKKYYWFQRHNDDKEMWVLHKPQECKNCPRFEVENNWSNKMDGQNNGEQAMSAITEDKQDNNDSNSDDPKTPLRPSVLRVWWQELISSLLSCLLSLDLSVIALGEHVKISHQKHQYYDYFVFMLPT